MVHSHPVGTLLPLLPPHLPMLRQRLPSRIWGMRPPGFSVIPLPQKEWISLDNQALFSQHLDFCFFPQLERCKHLWYRKAAQSGPVSVLISPISLPHLPQLERKTSSSLSSSSGLMCKAAPASGSRREMCASLNSLGAAPLHRRRLHRARLQQKPQTQQPQRALPANARVIHSSASSPQKRFMVALRPTSAFNYFTWMHTNHSNGCCTNVTIASH